MNRRYDVILGQDVLKKLGLVINFHAENVCGNNAVINMKPPDCTQESSYFLNNTAKIVEDTNRMSKILDAKYAPTDLLEVANANAHLTKNQK